MSKSSKLAAAALVALVASLGAATASAHGFVRHTVVVRPVVVRPVFVHRHVTPQITASEAARIRYQVQEHRQMQRRAAADGVITRREQIWLHRDAHQVRHLIHVAKTN
jgi:hypothetical protein